MQAKTLCTLDDCDGPRYKGGLCQHHARKAGLLIQFPHTHPTVCDIHPSRLGQSVMAGTVVLAR